MAGDASVMDGTELAQTPAAAPVRQPLAGLPVTLLSGARQRT